MSFVALSDSEIKDIANRFTSKDVSELPAVLADSLTQYSIGEDSDFQPHRSVVHRYGQVSLFMPATSQQGICVKIVGNPPHGRGPLRSVMTICDPSGKAVGVMAAEEFTAFRTSLGAMLLFPFRRKVESIVVFGGGKQEKWHIKLALLIRSKDIEKITIVNRSKDRAEKLIADIETTLPQHITSAVKVEKLDLKSPQSDGHVQNVLAEADAIFCTTPSTAPLFPVRHITSEEACKRSKYITAIGSYRLDMQELDPNLLRHIVDSNDATIGDSDKHNTIAVDSREACFQESGEIANAKLRPEQVSEVGGILNEVRSSSPAPGLSDWLANGLVVYKSVGIGVMDLSLGLRFRDLAKAKDIGVWMKDLS